MITHVSADAVDIDVAASYPADAEEIRVLSELSQPDIGALHRAV